MRLFISVVSHRHHSIIINLESVRLLAEDTNVEVVCRDNVHVHVLEDTCKDIGAHYIANKKPQGFAANNNANFIYCREQLGMRDDDYFVMFNPDVYIDKQNIHQLRRELRNRKPSLAVPNLFLDKEEYVHDDNIRTYPKFSQFVRTYLFSERTTMVNRRKKLKHSSNYWASCAFMAVRAELFLNSHGLDEKYYMYCEDVDFCYRLKEQGTYFHYLENVKAVHFRRRRSKMFLSKHFFWHVQSVLKYSLTKKTFQAKQSQLEQLNRQL
ncbi:glycosyltransferase family 2 protein [Vibrio sp. JC009]|uniref:glycosyltransferase n=1 Tax=Vibrio sp. JC009 TaxID=2912314 RepID=UPI0023AF1FEB|nr:glycosyltransferase [Vibrio sp. JC009]WED24149.1 glycosyltransferase family 2 protein [Vibrio sp. JC009]